jgi:hypothetical protein
MTGSPANSPEARALDRALIALHGSGRAAELSRLHTEAAAMMTDQGAERFHLTHAWVFALEAGIAEETALRRRLKALGGL